MTSEAEAMERARVLVYAVAKTKRDDVPNVSKYALDWSQNTYDFLDAMSDAVAAAILDAERRGYEDAARAAEARIPEKSNNAAEEIARDIRALTEHTDGK